MDIRVQGEPFDQGKLLSAFGQQDGVGAVVSFTGVVRGDSGLTHMLIEHYPGMTEKAILGMAEDAMRRWDLKDVLVVHRFGQLAASERIMMVATASAHRQAAFEAAEFLMDYLKSRAPFWKKELTESGDSWVDAKAADEAALSRWRR